MASGSDVAAGEFDDRQNQRELFGHPVGLYVLFFTELWERFSFYSMRGILTLYTAAVVLAALGKDKAGGQADSIYGAYLGFVYSTTFVGGMLADRLLGQRRAIYIGGTLMALAQFTLAAHALLVRGGTPVESLNWMFFLGLALLSCGNGFFKPNISTIVGTLYKQGDARRDAAFTIFYMGINIGALLASFSAGFAQAWGWHLGFILAGCGMILGQLIFTFGLGTLGSKGLPPPGATLAGGRYGLPNGLVLFMGIGAFIPLAGWLISNPQWVQDLALWIAGPIVAYLAWEAARARNGQPEAAYDTKTGALPSTTSEMNAPSTLEYASFGDSYASPRSLIAAAVVTAVGAMATVAASLYGEWAGLPDWLWMVPAVAAAAGLMYLVSRAIKHREGGQMMVILVLCTFSMMFWGFFELAGSTVTRFTEDAVNRVVFGREVPAAFVVNFLNPLMIVLFSIPVAGLWVWLGRKRLEPSSPFKFVLGLAQLSLGFLMFYIGAKEAQASGKSALVWLILGFFFHTTGELCLSPVGLSTITKLSPARLVGMFMGVWFLSSALGNVLAPRVADVTGLGFVDVFFRIVLITAGGAAVLLILGLPLKKMMHGVK